MHTKALIERMARYGYETSITSTAEIYPVSKEWTWDNEPELYTLRLIVDMINNLRYLFMPCKKAISSSYTQMKPRRFFWQSISAAPDGFITI